MNIVRFISHAINEEINFVYDNEKMISIIHISDLIDPFAYTYLYSLLSSLELTIREHLSLNFKNEDILNFLKMKMQRIEKQEIKEKRESEIKSIESNIDKIKIGEFQHFGFRTILNFVLEGDIKINHWKIKNKDTFENYVNIRNSIMHSKDIISRINDDSYMDFPFYKKDDFSQFFIIYKEIRELLLVI